MICNGVSLVKIASNLPLFTATVKNPYDRFSLNPRESS